MNPGTKPPLDVEAAIDLVLAAAAHRSNSARHSEFGKLLIDQYFVKLRDDYKADPVAKRYLDHLLAAAASAIRAFSVERDVFGTRWESLAEQKKHELERVNRLGQYSPLAEKNIWGRLISILGAGSIGGIAGLIGKAYFIPSNALIVFAILLAAALGLVGFEVFLNWYRDRQLKRVALMFPNSLFEQWQQRSLTSYRCIIKQFLISALIIREQCYPDLTSIAGTRLLGVYDVSHIDFSDQTLYKEGLAQVTDLDKLVDAIVERHFAFK